MGDTKNPDSESFRVFYCLSEMDVASTALFVGKPTPTGFRIGHKISQHHHHCGSGLAREEAQSAGENLIQKARTVPTTESDPTDWHALKPGSTLSFKPIHTG